MPKIAINVCYGGFGLSDEATELYLTKTGQVPFYKFVQFGCSTYASEPFVCEKTDGKYFFAHDLDRDDPVLIEVIEKLGKKANDRCAELKIVEIPDGIDWEISEYDGKEHVRQRSQSWS